jgi:hypothetical protein
VTTGDAGGPPAGFPAPPAYGTPFPTGDPGTRPRRRRRWPWVLGGLLATIVVLTVTGIVLFVQKIKPPIDATNDFLAALDTREFDDAYSQMCDRARRELTPDDLQSLYFGPENIAGYEVNPFDVDIDGSRATVGFDTDVLDDDQKFELRLRKENGDWRPCETDPGLFGFDLDFDQLG